MYQKPDTPTATIVMLFYQGSNLEFQDQNLTCYHYTIEQYYTGKFDSDQGTKVYLFSIRTKKFSDFFSCV